jgi:hypothetical protein
MITSSAFYCFNEAEDDQYGTIGALKESQKGEKKNKIE